MPSWGSEAPLRLGVLLLLASAVAWEVAVVPAQKEVDRLRAGSPSDAPSAEAVHRTGPVTSDPLKGLTLPSRQDLPDELARLNAIALGHNLVLRQIAVTYSDEVQSLHRCTASIPIQGDYLAIRGFLTEVMRDLSSSTLTSFSVERQSIAESAVEANIELDLYFRD